MMSDGFVPVKVISNSKSVVMLTDNGKHSDRQTENTVNVTIDCVMTTVCVKVHCCLLLIGY